MDAAFLRRAIELAVANVAQGGGPFAALVVKDGAVVAEGVNRVTLANDPTAHAEVEAIRAACANLRTFQLTGCDVYASCEPCPMCLGAIYWARAERVFYAATAEDAARAGFDDAFVYTQLSLHPAQRAIPMLNVLRDEAGAPFAAWTAQSGRVDY